MHQTRGLGCGTPSHLPFRAPARTTFPSLTFSTGEPVQSLSGHAARHSTASPRETHARMFAPRFNPPANAHARPVLGRSSETGPRIALRNLSLARRHIPGGWVDPGRLARSQ